MKKLLSIFIGIFIFLFCNTAAYAESINKVISNSGVNKSAISVSIKDANTGKTVFSLNPNQPMPPASTLKLLTLAASVDTLGADYEFKTQLYKNTNNELFLKLGADPFLKSSSLSELIKAAKSKKILSPKAIYIDDYIFDSNEWGEGWQWDDDLNKLMPKFSSYNIDGNLLGVLVSPTTKGAPANISTLKFYPTMFINLVTTDETTSVSLSRKNHISPDSITAEGTVSQAEIIPIPVNHPKRYFILRLEETIRNEKFDYYANFPQKKLPASNVYLIAEIKHPIKYAIIEILKESNNLVAETVFKLAGAKYVNNTGSLNNSLKMLEAYCKKESLNLENIKVVDGSGVSKNNLMTTGFMAEFLAKQAKKPKFEIIKTLLPTPGEGTLENRMLYFKDNLRAKTGTLSDVSAIAGYLTSRNGKTYAFDIMINDPKLKPSDKKQLEEYILRSVYTNY